MAGSGTTHLVFNDARTDRIRCKDGSTGEQQDIEALFTGTVEENPTDTKDVQGQPDKLISGAGKEYIKNRIGPTCINQMENCCIPMKYGLHHQSNV